MPCYQQSPGGTNAVRNLGTYATEADCLNACKEGACCESNGTCNVRPQCQCQGAEQTFRGVGTVCTPNPCGCSSACGPDFPSPQSVALSISNWAGIGGANFRDYKINGTYAVQRKTLITTVSDCFAYDLFGRSPSTCIVNQSTWAFGAANYDLVVLGNASLFNVYMKNITSVGNICFQWRASLVIPSNALCQSPVDISGVAATIERTDGNVPLGTFQWRITSNPLP